MGIISFEDYVIDESTYSVNPNFDVDTTSGLNLPVDFEAEIGVDQEQEKAYVMIRVKLGNFKDSNLTDIPFTCEVLIRGIFGYSKNDFESKEALKEIFGVNAIAILFPYLRSYISNLTSSSNQFPAYILPVMNFAEMLKEKDAITFIGFE